MDMEEIRYLLGGTVFARAKAYTDRIQDLNCEVAGNGVRHLSADVRGGGRSLYQTQVWLRENGSFVSASCSCPYNENGEGPCCKHIGALLMWDSESQGLSGRAPQKPSESPESIPGVVRGTANLQTPQPEEPPRRDSYASSLEMLFGKKWRGEEPESDYEARRLLRAYQEGALAEVDGVTGHAELRPHSAELEPELTLLPGELPWLRLRISADGGRQYVVKSIPDLLRAVEKHGFISYGKALEFRHSWEAFAPEAQQLLRLLRRQLSAKEGAEAALRSYGNAPRSGPAGGIPLNGEIFDGLVALYAPTGNLGGYTLKTGIPALTMRVEKRRGGVEVSVTPALGWKTGLDNDYLYSEDTIWQLDRAESARMRPALEALCGKSLFFTTGDATAFCSYVLPELGSRVTIEDPERLLLNQIPLEPVVQFYLDAPTRETVRAHLEFLYGEDRVTPEEPGPAGLLRDARAEQRAGRLLGRYLEPGPDTMGNGLAAHYDAYEEDEVYRFLDEGIPALLAEQWDGADVVVTSYDLLRRDETLYENQKFYACILDEAQAIKNHTTQKYKAVCGVNSRVRFALTGTPVENRLGELWSIFSFLMPGYLPPYKSFCSRFEKPITQENDPAAVRRLNQLTGPFILRRMKSEVLKELPPKTENVYRIELEEEQRKLYLAAVVDAREKLRAAKPEDKMAVFAVLMRLREICCDPRLIADNWTGGSAKLDACIELVTSAVESGHRILLFSQFTSMLELLAKRLDAEGVSHFTLQGSTPKPVRAELVRRFNGGEASVFLISLRAGGTGLNLTAADIVIHYDPWWNVAAQNQATDRAYRIGQQNPVQVYKLIAQDTIEEKIVELQQAKQDLAETVTGSADGAILRMKPEELLNLLEGTE